MQAKMSIALVVLVYFACVNAFGLNVPSFEPFDYSGNYKIKGTGYNRNTFAPTVTASNNVTLYVNSNNSRILWDNGNGNSYFLSMANGSYFWGDIIRNPVNGALLCLYRPDFNYTRTLLEYSKSFGTKTIGAISSYFGSVFDYGSCGAKLNHRTDVINVLGSNVIVRQEFAQQLFVFGSCIDLYGTVEMNILTLRSPTVSEFDTAFQLPPQCLSGTVDYCSFAYPGDLCH